MSDSDVFIENISEQTHNEDQRKQQTGLVKH